MKAISALKYFKKNKLQLTTIGLEFYNSIEPHYKALNSIVNEFRDAQDNFTVNILIDGFPYLNAIKTHENKKFNFNLDCKTLKNITNDLSSGKYSLIISPLDINVENEKILKIKLRKEKVGIVIHKDLISDECNIHEVINNNFMIHSATCLGHVVMKKLIKRFESINLNIRVVATNEINLLFMLKDKLGYSISSECFYNKNHDIMKDLLFIEEPFNLSLNRRAYFLKSDIHFFDMNLFECNSFELIDPVNNSV